MEFAELEQSIVMKTAEAFYENLSCLIYVDHHTQKYSMIKGDRVWEHSLEKKGSLSKLFFQLFTNIGDDNTTENSKYKKFRDEKFFEKENYYGYIEVVSEDRKIPYSLSLFQISDNEAVIMLQSEENVDAVNRIELDKIDAIQESYLFSMIVNLAEDSCINPNTTELSAARQDFLDIHYSDWRLMISNMFKESDRDVFLRMSSPEYIINTLEEQVSFELELQMMNIKGEFIWSKLTFTRMKDFSRENPRFVYTVQDYQKEMTRFLTQESIVKAVEQQNRELQELEKERTKFFSNMSHEIRTPINAILGMNEVIFRESGEENIRGYSKDIKSSGRFLLSIVNDILDYSKIKAGKMEIVPAEYELLDMVKEINLLMKSYMGEKKLDYVVKISEKLPRRLYGDEVRIKQVIVNLLTNAIKYTPEGKVVFEITPAKTESESFALAVKVSDTGIGIKEEELERLFLDYGRLDLEKNRKIEGTGLGMGIVTSLLNQMGSSLQVESRYGEGSVFSFVLPQKVVEVSMKKDTIEPQIDVKGKKVLLVDDNFINLNVAKILLGKLDLQVDAVDSGKKCLQALEEKAYDLVLLDHMMPEMDGVETLAEIRKKYKMPVIVMTANAGSGLRNEYQRMGFTDYLEKPIVPERLSLIMKTYLAGICTNGSLTE